MIKKLKVFVFFLCMIWGSAFAQSNCGVKFNNSNITILFVNGIKNDEQAACDSNIKLVRLMAEKGIDISKLNTTYFYNKGNGNVNDVHELRIQAAISSEAIASNTSGTTFEYYNRLGTIYNNLILGSRSCTSFLFPRYKFTAKLENCEEVLHTTKALADRLERLSETDGVVIVAHSQGNFYLEAAYSLLFVNGKNLDKFKGVGVAAISNKPISDKYLTILQDNALYHLQDPINIENITNNLYHPANFNSVACATESDCSSNGSSFEALRNATGSTGMSYIGDDLALIHEFVEVYLNPSLKDLASKKTLPSIIAEMIQNSINELGGGNTSSHNIEINPIGMQYISSRGTSYETGLSITIPRSSSYDTATVTGFKIDSSLQNVAPNGTLSMRDTGKGSNLEFVYPAGFTDPETVLYFDGLPARTILMGAQYTVNLYNHGQLFSTQKITLKADMLAPTEMKASMFPSLSVSTQSGLCPGGVKTTATWYALPSSLSQATVSDLTCSALNVTAQVESGDASYRRFKTYFTAEGDRFTLVSASDGTTYSKQQCVFDKKSGLFWEGKTAAGVRSGDKTYTNYTSTSLPQRAISQIVNGSTVTFIAENPTADMIDIGEVTTGYPSDNPGAYNAKWYVDQVNEIALCGRTNWRIPTMSELEGLAKTNYGSTDSTLDQEWFPNSPTDESLYPPPIYFSSTAGLTDYYVKTVGFRTGYITSGSQLRGSGENLYYYRASSKLRLVSD